MGILSWLFGKKKFEEDRTSIRQRENQPDVMDVSKSNEVMNWAMEKANLTLHYFESCLKNPNEGQDYFSIKVKIVDGDKAEHIWLTDPDFDQEGNLYGVVGNEPIDVENVVLGQKIGIDRQNISDWMIVENGRLIGGYTIRAMREGLSGKALENFDKNLGGIYVDDGEDYFIVDDTTPEGAIILLEEAYNRNDLDMILYLKDFHAEAKTMLNKINSEFSTPDIIDQTAETLKLSFTKAIQENMPKFVNVKRAFPKREFINENELILSEVIYEPNNTYWVSKHRMLKNENVWKVLGPEE